MPCTPNVSCQPLAHPPANDTSVMSATKTPSTSTSTSNPSSVTSPTANSAGSKTWSYLCDRCNFRSCRRDTTSNCRLGRGSATDQCPAAWTRRVSTSCSYLVPVAFLCRTLTSYHRTRYHWCNDTHGSCMIPRSHLQHPIHDAGSGVLVKFFKDAVTSDGIFLVAPFAGEVAAASGI